MKKGRVAVVSFLCVFLLVLYTGRDTLPLMAKDKTQPARITNSRNNRPDFRIKEGYVSQRQETVKVYDKGRDIARIKLSEPRIVAQSDKVEKWGYFQFPGICRSDDGKLIISWQMSEDSHKSYGKGENGRLMSRDEGKTWEPLDQNYYIRGSRTLELRNGDVLQVSTPASKDIHNYPSFPKPVCSDKSQNMNFYLESELPEDLRGMYLNIRSSKTKEISRIHGALEDPYLIRYAIDDLMPIMWWGDIKELDDGSMIAGVYRCYYQDISEEEPRSGITFYKSVDGGSHWKSIGKIPYHIKELTDETRHYDKTRGFSEASFEILNDSSFFCVIRTGYNTPMYKTFSYDKGEHWTEPEAFTPNGVKPMLLQLGNGVMAMASGRPGLQLRFSIEGDGKIWTEPIEMLPLKDEKGYLDIWSIGCGYPSMLPVDDHTFYLVYSDFRKKNKQGEYRKAIMFRKIEVIKK